MINQKYLKECFMFDADTGCFTWNKRPRCHFGSDSQFKSWNSRYAESEAGALDKYGYQSIAINGKKYKSHRLAWIYVYGVPPEGDIDHINQVKGDNRIVNLRDCSRSANMFNTGLRLTNTSGIKGVSWDKQKNKWIAQIKINYKNIYLGRFSSLTDAGKARAEAEKKYGIANTSATLGFTAT